MRTALQAKFNSARDYVIMHFVKLNRREQILVAVAAGALLCVAAYVVYQPIQNALDQQALELANMQSRSKIVSGTIEQYLKLKSRREAIEAHYKEVEFKDGVQSHIEGLIRSKAQVQTGYNIKDPVVSPFGRSYEQLSFGVTFQTSNLAALVDFLREVVHGSRPLILRKVDLQRSRIGDRLDVALDMNSLRKVKK